MAISPTPSTDSTDCGPTMAQHQVIAAARSNARGAGAERWLLELVACAEPGRHFGVRRAANALLQVLANAQWWVSSGSKRGGLGAGLWAFRGRAWPRRVGSAVRWKGWLCFGFSGDFVEYAFT